ncbi:MAG TPA: hypothetical protein VNW92_09265 [Polyangiaceae bacterium]|nr:hypothetical protein [Polyangiaceae bacterium]
MTRAATKPSVDLDALLCALTLVPTAFARNRFFSLFENPAALKVRRRASRVRGIIRQLCGTGRVKAEIIGEQVMEDGQVLLRYRVEELGFSRTAALSRLEAATLRFALFRAGSGSVNAEDRELVESALERLSRNLDLPTGFLVNAPAKDTLAPE